MYTHMYTQHTYMHHLHTHAHKCAQQRRIHTHAQRYRHTKHMYTQSYPQCTHKHTHAQARVCTRTWNTHKMSHTGHDEAPKPWEMLLQPVFPVIFVFPEPPHRRKCIGVENRKSNCPKIFPKTETSVDCAVRLSSLFPPSFILKSVEEENASNQAQVELIHVKREAEAPLGRRTSCVR